MTRDQEARSEMLRPTPTSSSRQARSEVTSVVSPHACSIWMLALLEA